METIKRYSMKMCDMAKHSTPRWVSSRSKNVNKEFLDTPGRRQFRVMIRLLGLVFFALTVVSLIAVLLTTVLGIHLGSKSFQSEFPAAAGLFILNFFNVIGMMVELAGDNGGSNWFARGFLLSLVSLFGTFMIFALISLF